jgi:two-component system, NarL family, sensor histidine kinase DesK
MATRSTNAVPTATAPEDRVLTDTFRDRHVPGNNSPWRWFFSGVWLAYLISPIAQLFDRHDAVWIAGGLILAVAFCGLYLPVLMFSDTRPRLSAYGLVGLAVLAATACLIYGKTWTPLWIYVSAAAGMVLTSVFDRRRASVGVFVIAALYLLFCRVTHLDTGSTLAVLLPVLLIGLAMIGFRLQISLMRELAQARGAVAKLAANEERLRLARDMHDLTGQSLSMITLKSELAAKRLARLSPSQERDAVLAELGDIAGSAGRRCMTSGRRSAATGGRRSRSRSSRRGTRSRRPASSSTTTPNSPCARARSTRTPRRCWPGACARP